MVGFLVAVSAVVGVTMYLHRGPDWVGTTQRVTVEKLSCGNPESLRLHGSVWDSPDMAPKAWADRSAHPGRIRFDTAHTATFTGDDGTVVHFAGGRGQFDLMPCVVDAN